MRTGSLHETLEAMAPLQSRQSSKAGVTICASEPPELLAAARGSKASFGSPIVVAVNASNSARRVERRHSPCDDRRRGGWQVRRPGTGVGVHGFRRIVSDQSAGNERGDVHMHMHVLCSDQHVACACGMCMCMCMCMWHVHVTDQRVGDERGDVPILVLPRACKGRGCEARVCEGTV